jgi:hypothetical protein
LLPSDIPISTTIARYLLTSDETENATCPEGKAVAKLFDCDRIELWLSKPKRGRHQKDAEPSSASAKRWH